MLASSTPDALWSAPALRLLRPSTVACRKVSSGRLLDRCSLSVAAGTRLLLVGDPPEAASLLLRVLAGLVRPRRGSVSVAGIEGPASSVGGRRAAYADGRLAFAEWMTPREALRLSASLLSIPRASVPAIVERASRAARLPAEALDVPLSSHGPDVMERTDLAAAVLGDPEVLLLDDPLPSLGVGERAQLLRFEGERRTVVMTSRAPQREVEHATHVALLGGGRIAVLASIPELLAAGVPPTPAGLRHLAPTAAEPAAIGESTRDGQR